MSSTTAIGQYHIPGNGARRESLREKGQFWTPDWIAEAMVAYVALNSPDHIFDPAVGTGAFFRAAKNATTESGASPKLLGFELDPNALNQARFNGLSSEDLARVQIEDFILNPPARPIQSHSCQPAIHTAS